MNHETIGMLQESLERVEKRLRLLQTACALATLTLAAVWLCGERARAEEDPAKILRLRGLIIEDQQGRERILLGAPVPSLPGRKRGDGATGLIVLGENGADRVAVGYPVPDPQVMGKVGRRILPSAGIVASDADGNERGGFGVLDNGRANVCLDYPTREAICLTVMPQEGFAGLIVNSEQGSRAERAELAVLKDGTSLMKLADTSGMERAMLVVRPHAAAKFLGINPKDESTVDVGLLRLNPFTTKRMAVAIKSLWNVPDSIRP